MLNFGGKNCAKRDKKKNILTLVLSEFYFLNDKKKPSSNLVTLVNQKSTTSSCIDNFCFCLSINKNGRIIRFQ